MNESFINNYGFIVLILAIFVSIVVFLLIGNPIVLTKADKDILKKSAEREKALANKDKELYRQMVKRDKQIYSAIVKRDNKYLK